MATKATEPIFTLTTEQLAQRRGVAAGTLCQWRRRGCGPRYLKAPTGRREIVRYAIKDLEDWLEEHVRECTRDPAPPNLCE